MTGSERRAFIVETVVELAAKQNPNEITTTAIAKHMGVTQGALFKHFPSKDAMLQAVMGWVSNRLLSRLDMAVDSESSPVAAIEAMFMAHVHFVSEHPGVPRMLFGELQRAEQTVPKRMAQTLLGKYGERLCRLMEEGKRVGELPDALDIDASITLLVGMTQGLVMQSLISGDVSQISRDAPRVFDIYRRGIGVA